MRCVRRQQGLYAIMYVVNKFVSWYNCLIHHKVTQQAREMTNENFSKFMNELNGHASKYALFFFVHFPPVHMACKGHHICEHFKFDFIFIDNQRFSSL